MKIPWPSWETHFLMRVPCLLLSCAVAFSAQSQTATPTEKGRSYAIVQVQRDSTGANLVRISILDPKYPVEALKSQAEQIGVLSGSGSRGIQFTDDPIDPKKPGDARLLRVLFGADGLIDRQGTWVRIAPIVKALAAAPPSHPLEDIQIDFDFEVATPVDLGNYSSPYLQVSRRSIDRTLEYDVHLNSPHPQNVEIPDFAPAPQKPLPVLQPSRLNPEVIAALAVAVLAVGALVYCLFLLSPAYRRKFRT